MYIYKYRSYIMYFETLRPEVCDYDLLGAASSPRVQNW